MSFSITTACLYCTIIYLLLYFLINKLINDSFIICICIPLFFYHICQLEWFTKDKCIALEFGWNETPLKAEFRDCAYDAFVMNSSDTRLEDPNADFLRGIHNRNLHNRQKVETTGQTIQISTESKAQANREIQESRQKIRIVTGNQIKLSEMQCNTNKTSQRVKTQGLIGRQ